jgi:hypothetical protein
MNKRSFMRSTKSIGRATRSRGGVAGQSRLPVEIGVAEQGDLAGRYLHPEMVARTARRSACFRRKLCAPLYGSRAASPAM